jgi:hypothetical protein
MDQALKENVVRLCQKVMEVVGNNDWPTTEGQRGEHDDFGERIEGTEETPSEIEQLVNEILDGVTKL